MIHNLAGFIHLAAALSAILLGAIVLLNRKGSPTHRVLGYVYVLAMLLTLVTAFSLYRLTGAFNLLHVAAVASTLTLAFGLRAVWRRRRQRNWLRRHYQLMAWSYIGLIAAFVSEASTRLGMPWLLARGYQPGTWFWGLIGFSTFMVLLCGMLILQRAEAGQYWQGLADGRRGPESGGEREAVQSDSAGGG